MVQGPLQPDLRKKFCRKNPSRVILMREKSTIKKSYVEIPLPDLVQMRPGGFPFATPVIMHMIARGVPAGL
jgi:hypothetical protein